MEKITAKQLEETIKTLVYGSCEPKVCADCPTPTLKGWNVCRKLFTEEHRILFCWFGDMTQTELIEEIKKDLERGDYNG